MSESKIKVTDRRMFTEDGELRADFQPEDDDRPTPPKPPPAETRSAPPHTVAPSPDQQRPPMDEAPEPPGGRTAELLDLVGLLYEQIALSMGDATLPGGESVQDLRRARIYIDMLGVLQEKTKGNLTPDEKAVIDDLVYRLRLRYVEKQRG